MCTPVWKHLSTSLVTVSSSEHVFPLHSGWANWHSLLLPMVPSPQETEQEAQAPQGVQAASTGCPRKKEKESRASS